jgi:hypothetical protein
MTPLWEKVDRFARKFKAIWIVTDFSTLKLHAFSLWSLRQHICLFSSVLVIKKTYLLVFHYQHVIYNTYSFSFSAMKQPGYALINPVQFYIKEVPYIISISY